MNLVKSIQPLLTLFGIDTGRETAVTVLPHQEIARQDRNVTIINVAPVMIAEAQRQPVQPQPQPPTQRPEMVTYYRQWRYHYQSGGHYWLDGQNNPAPSGWVSDVYQAAREGRLVIVDMIPTVPWLQHERELWAINEAAKRGGGNGRIVLREQPMK